VAQVEAETVPAWAGIHSAAWGSCTATPVVDMYMSTDMGISPDLAWAWSQEVWAPFLAAVAVAWTTGTNNSMVWGSCTAKRAAGMDMGPDTGT